MNLNELRDNAGSRLKSKRLGRGIGSGKGKTSGKGVKGQKAREGVALNGFEGGQLPIYRRLPKRGFKNPTRVEYDVVNLDTLSERFKAGTVVTQQALRDVGVLKGGRRKLKVLGRGDITIALTVQAHKFSGTAAEKIAAAGGQAEALA